jgi:GxxExxY protein
MEDDDGRFNKKKKPPLRRPDLILPELSYQIVGSLFDVSNELGAGHLERVYQRATARALQERGIAFREQVRIPLQFSNAPVGWYQLDFLI